MKNERIIKREFLIDYYQDDEEMIPGILGAVQKDLPALKSQLTHALDSEDKKALQLLSHKLKSSIEMQRINQLNETFSELRELREAENFSQWKGNFFKLLSTFSKLKIELEEEIEFFENFN